MNTQTLSQTITMHHGSLTLDLTAQEVQQNALQRAKNALRRMDSLAVRIAVPPLAIWGVLYCVVEHLI